MSSFSNLFFFFSSGVQQENKILAPDFKQQKARTNLRNQIEQKGIKSKSFIKRDCCLGGKVAQWLLSSLLVRTAGSTGTGGY